MSDREPILSRLWRRALGLVDALYGYDFFISYAHKDGQVYARALRDQLQDAGPYRVFLDERDFDAGEDLDFVTYQRIENTRELIILARPEALSVSDWCYREARHFSREDAVPNIININGSVERADVVDGKLSGLLAENAWLWIADETSGAADHPNDGPPGPEVAPALHRGFRKRRVRRRRALIFAAAAGVLAAMAIAASALFAAAVAERSERAEQVLRLLKPQAMSPAQQARTTKACRAVKAEGDAPMRPYPQIPGAEPARSPGQLAQACAAPELAAMTTEEARAHVEPGIDWIFADGGAKLTYTLARMTEDPLRSSLFDLVTIAPFEALMIAQSHNLTSQCAARLLGRAHVNGYLCSMRQTEPGQFPQHYP